MPIMPILLILYIMLIMPILPIMPIMPVMSIMPIMPILPIIQSNANTEVQYAVRLPVTGLPGGDLLPPAGCKRRGRKRPAGRLLSPQHLLLLSHQPLLLFPPSRLPLLLLPPSRQPLLVPRQLEAGGLPGGGGGGERPLPRAAGALGPVRILGPRPPLRPPGPAVQLLWGAALAVV
jgi:hypothetical protein